MDHLQISWSLRPVFLLPGQESRRRSQKGPGEVFSVPSSLPPQRDAVAKGWPGGNGGSPHLEKRNPRLFWRGECFFARAGDQLVLGNALYSQNLLKLKPLQKETRFPFQLNKLVKIRIFQKILSQAFFVCKRVKGNPSVTGAQSVFVVAGGPGGTRRKHRRDEQRLGERAEPPPNGAGGLAPAPSTEKSVLMVPSGPSGPPGPGSSRPDVPPPFITTAHP